MNNVMCQGIEGKQDLL